MQDKPNTVQPLPPLFTICWWFFCLVLTINFINGINKPVETIPYSTFLQYVQDAKVSNLKVSPKEVHGEMKVPNHPGQFTTVRVDDPDLAKKLKSMKVTFEGTSDDNAFTVGLSWILPPLVFVGVWLLAANMFNPGAGMSKGILSMGKNPARIYKEANIKVTFKDVAGVDEAKEELSEVINFLKDTKYYSRLGGHLPKGILLVGPPGTGKTLLARAVAGEAGVPFYSISGSEFVELFVGVGAARVRDLFAEAKKNSPCIIFIDELDALGRARGLSQAGGHDEKEQTLNQLLVELDGFDPTQGLVLIAATNRPEILDAALLRAGRFDRHVLVDRPDKTGRAQILLVHLRNVVLDEQVNIEEIAASTPGFTGADLANFVNEAVLHATRRDAEKVSQLDFTNALERVVAGLEKKNRLLNQFERAVVAHHEMGHALVSMVLDGTDPVLKVSIIPRGIGALGYTMQRPLEDRFLMSKEELQAKLMSLMGGRAAEQIIFDREFTGSADDLTKATAIARNMVMRYGMSESFAPVTYESDPSPFLNDAPQGEPLHLSDQTAREIDCEIRQLVANALSQAKEILQQHKPLLEETARQLLASETLNQIELDQIRTQLTRKTLPPSSSDKILSLSR